MECSVLPGHGSHVTDRQSKRCLRLGWACGRGACGIHWPAYPVRLKQVKPGACRPSRCAALAVPEGSSAVRQLGAMYVPAALRKVPLARANRNEMGAGQLRPRSI